jgi:Trypsin
MVASFLRSRPVDIAITDIAGSSVWVPAVAMTLASLTGCASEPSDSTVEARVAVGTSDPTIYGGTEDDDGEAAPGVVALRVGTGGTFELCSAALIAPNVVVTARHCVTKNVSTSVSCDEDGRSANGPHVSADEEPSTIGVYVGANPRFAGDPVSRARAIVAPTGPYLCDSDIALIVLETPILNIAPLPVRMHSAAYAGELVRAVGYGQNDSAMPIGTRFRKAGVAVLAQGKGVSPSNTPLGAHEFEVGRSICRGDSGGPAISEQTGAVIGVVSRGGDCEEDFGHIYTTTAGFPDVFGDAFKLADAAPTPENGDINVDTRAQGTSPTGRLDSDPSSGACDLAQPGSTDAGAGSRRLGLGLVIAALGALGLRRRRAIGAPASARGREPNRRAHRGDHGARERRRRSLNGRRPSAGRARRRRRGAHPAGTPTPSPA